MEKDFALAAEEDLLLFGHNPFRFFQGNGPEYVTSDISPSRKISIRPYRGGSLGILQDAKRFQRSRNKEFTEMPIRLIFGKSLVGGSATSDVFEGITASPVAYPPTRAQ